MARRDFKTATQTPAANGRKSGRGTLIILVLGMTLGIALTLALTQWLTAKPEPETPAPTAKKTPSAKDPAPKQRPPPKPAPAPTESVSPSPKAPAPRVVPTPAPVVVPAPAAAARPTAPVVAAPVAPPKKPPSAASDLDRVYTQNTTPTIAPPLKPREIWWMQIAALRKEDDARRLRARLLLLNLDVVITPSDDGTSYRVRVGPFKTEALARANEGLLLRNNLTPRLIKEPVYP